MHKERYPGGVGGRADEDIRFACRDSRGRFLQHQRGAFGNARGEGNTLQHVGACHDNRPANRFQIIAKKHLRHVETERQHAPAAAFVGQRR